MLKARVSRCDTRSRFIFISFFSSAHPVPGSIAYRVRRSSFPSLEKKKMTDNGYGSPARSCYGSPARSLKMSDRVHGSPARSYCGDHSSATESEGEETFEMLTEVPRSSADQTIMDGWLKFRDNKKVSMAGSEGRIYGCGAIVFCRRLLNFKEYMMMKYLT